MRRNFLLLVFACVLLLVGMSGITVMFAIDVAQHFAVWAMSMLFCLSGAGIYVWVLRSVRHPALMQRAKRNAHIYIREEFREK